MAIGLQLQIAAKEAAVAEWKAKFAKVKAANDDLTKQLNSSSRCLEGLPTADEHAANLRKLKFLREDKEKAEKSLSHMERKLSDAVKDQKSRTQLVESLQLSQTQLKGEVDSLKQENAGLSADNERLSIDLDKANKLVESQQAWSQRQQSMTSQLLVELHDQQTATVTALRQELCDKEVQLQKANQTCSENREMLNRRRTPVPPTLLVPPTLRQLPSTHSSSASTM